MGRIRKFKEAVGVLCPSLKILSGYYVEEIMSGRLRPGDYVHLPRGYIYACGINVAL